MTNIFDFRGDTFKTSTGVDRWIFLILLFEGFLIAIGKYDDSRRLC